MRRIATLFKNKKHGILNVYCTAGFPLLESTLPVIRALEESGVDMIEVGIPYSDPIADGPVIQHSNAIALSNGISIQKIFEQLSDLRKHVSLPVILMGYLNPVIQYGFSNFCRDAAAAGIDGLIIPDLPVHEFEAGYGSIIHQAGLDFIFLVTPQTPKDRVIRLDRLGTGFIYAVSSSSTTGGQALNNGLAEYIRGLKELPLRNPVLVGFGIHSRQDFATVCTLTEGAIIGSAFIKALENSVDVKATTKSFVSSIIG